MRYVLTEKGLDVKSSFDGDLYSDSDKDSFFTSITSSEEEDDEMLDTVDNECYSPTTLIKINRQMTQSM